MSSAASSEPDDNFRFLLPQGVGDTEEVEWYRLGGFHPVHLGDVYDHGRYRIVHKLGAGGFATVWLARDSLQDKWVALKIVEAERSQTVAEKSELSHHATSKLVAKGAAFVTQHERQFTFDGPNGQHLCLVLPVLGPSLSGLSYHFDSRLTPRLARRAAYQATRAVADLHSEGLCHGDVTPGNILLRIVESFDSLQEDEVYRLFGRPITGELETESGQPTGPEAPRYIVKAIDFLSRTKNMIKPDIRLIDFDQCFRTASPPEKLLGTPLEFLAPEVAVGQPASPASDVWALGCCIFRLRSGEGPFSNPFELGSPEDLVNFIIHTLGQEMPPEWQETTRWDPEGRPTKDRIDGKPHEQWWDGPPRSLRELVYNIWDEPEGRAARTGTTRPQKPRVLWQENQPFAEQFSDMAWNPTAVKVDDVYLSGYNDEWDTVLEVLPKIPEDEAALLYDLLSKIFVLDPNKRLTAEEMLWHPWFHLDGSLDGPWSKAG